MARFAAHAAPVEVVRGAGRAALLLQKTRRQLLEELREPDSAAGLARKLRLPRQRLNYHLRALEREGLVELVEERRKGNCVERIVRATARSYVISPEVLGAIGAGADIGHAVDRHSAGYLMTAAAGALHAVGTLHERATREGKRLATLTIDADIRFANAESRAAFAEELANTLAALVAKYHDDRTPAGRRFRLLAAIHPALDPQTRKP